MATHAPGIGVHAVPAPSGHDPVLDAILRAPLSATPETDEERAAFEALMDDVASGRPGRFVGPVEIAATIAAMRREAGE